MRVDPMHRALADLAEGRAVVLAHHEGSRSQGDLVFAADLATPALVSFIVGHTAGHVCVALPERDADRLALPAVVAADRERRGAAYAVSVDAGAGIGTGISATDRARTIRLLADPGTAPADLTRPGHILPVRTDIDGVLSSPSRAEAAVDLMVLAGRRPAGVLAGIVSGDDPMSMAHGEELRRFADRHNLALVSIADLVEHRRKVHTVVTEAAPARLPLEQGEFTAVGYRNSDDGREHLALVFGDIGDGLGVVVGVHSECQLGDVFGSLQCRCAAHLDLALSTIVREGRGVLLYIRSGGAGSGLLAALTAHEHGRAGCRTDATLRPEELCESPDYLAGTSILAALGVRTLRLLGDDKVRGVAPRHREPDAGALAAVRTHLPSASCPGSPPARHERHDEGRRAVRVATGAPV